MKFVSEQNRIFGLDVIRALAIVFVVLAHGKFLLRDSLLEGFPFIRIVDGVELFFVLSGFLIGTILLKTISVNPKPNGRDLLHFWKRRWFRTLPNYYLILGLNYLIVRYEVIREDISQFGIEFVFFLQNFAWSFQGFFWESWSLAVEEWFYILFPILLWGGLRFVRPKLWFVLVVIFMIIIPIMYRHFQFDPNMDGFTWDISLRKVVLARLDSIGYGLLAAWVAFYYSNRWKTFRVIALTIGMTMLGYLIFNKWMSQSYFKQVFYLSLLPLSISFLFPFFSFWKQGRGKLAYVTVFISKISYSMYLINLALIAEVIRDNFAPSGGLDAILKYVLYWVLVMVCSTLLYLFFERPMMNLRDRK